MGIYIFIILPILGIVNRFWVEYCIIKIRCDMEFKDILKSIRKEKGMTQKDVYTLLNISPNGYASWEQGRTVPDIKSIKKLCKIFDVSADYLLGIKDENEIQL